MAQVLGPCTPWETRRKHLAPGFGSAQHAGCSGHLGGEPAEGRPFSLSLSHCLTLPVKKQIVSSFLKFNFIYLKELQREVETEREIFHLLVHSPDGHYGWHAAPIQSQEPGASSWSPMGCRAQALGPSSTALPGHSRELAWKRSNRDRTWCPDRD